MLRDYQTLSVEKSWSSMVDGRNPIVVLPTGSGKSWVIAGLCQRTVIAGGRVIVLCHRKELIEQNREKIEGLLDGVPVGVYSAGLNSKSIQEDVIVAGIQSVYEKAADLVPRHVVLIDECHLVPNRESGMYHKFMNELKMFVPKLRVVGLSATPYRLDDGDLLDGDVFDYVCIDVPVDQLMNQGHLCRLTNLAASTQVDMANLDVARGEFTVNSMETAFSKILESSVREIIQHSQHRKSILIFTASIKHGETVSDMIRQATGDRCEFVDGDTPAMFRDLYLKEFKNGSLRWLVNVNVLTTGFDATCIDCVAVMRATLSAGLFAQMLGRGLRTHPNKQDCLVLDFGRNLFRHGPINDPEYGRRKNRKGESSSEPAEKKCPECDTIQAASIRICWNCGYEFPEELKIEQKPDTKSVILVSPPEWKTVAGVEYRRHFNRTKESTTLRVDYECDGGNLDLVQEWVCIEHEGFARQKAVSWWKDRSMIDVPDDVDDAVDLANRCALRCPSRIFVKQEGRWNRIIRVEFDSEKPYEVIDESYWDDGDEDIPF